jgi:hypothetical protein
MITVRIEEETALAMLMDRLEYWTTDPTETELFEKMYQQYLDEGLFDGDNFDVMAIVDNDYVNWCSIITKDDEDYEEVKAAYESDDWTTDKCRVEAEANGAFIVRWY